MRSFFLLVYSRGHFILETRSIFTRKCQFPEKKRGTNHWREKLLCRKHGTRRGAP
jgi:hypothetical protein